SLSQTPLFQVMFVLQNASGPALSLPGLTVRPLKVETHTSKFDLTLSLRTDRNGLTASLEYNTDLYEPTTIRRMLLHYREVLEGVLTNPEQRLSQLPLEAQPTSSQLTQRRVRPSAARSSSDEVQADRESVAPR